MAVCLGVIHMVSSTSIEANLDRLDALLAEVVATSAEVVFLPRIGLPLLRSRRTPSVSRTLARTLPFICTWRT